VCAASRLGEERFHRGGGHFRKAKTVARETKEKKKKTHCGPKGDVTGIPAFQPCAQLECRVQLGDHKKKKILHAKQEAKKWKKTRQRTKGGE